MKKLSLKTIGTNQTTKHLDGKIFSSKEFTFTQKPQVLPIKLEELTYLFDIKSVSFLESGVLLSGFISDENKNVGRISLKYSP